MAAGAHAIIMRPMIAGEFTYVAGCFENRRQTLDLVAPIAGGDRLTICIDTLSSGHSGCVGVRGFTLWRELFLAIPADLKRKPVPLLEKATGTCLANYMICGNGIGTYQRPFQRRRRHEDQRDNDERSGMRRTHNVA